MKRTPLARNSPLSRSAPMGRRGGVRKRNVKRFKQRHEAAFGEQAQRCRESRCIACLLLGMPQSWLTEPHHDPCRPRGKDEDTVPLCSFHHTGSAGVHVLGRETFWANLGVTFESVRDRMRAGGTIRTIAESYDDLPLSPLLLWLDGP